MAFVRRCDSVWGAASALAFALLVAGCDESLPPRLPDPNAIGVDVTMAEGRVFITGGTLRGNGGVIVTRVTNVYTEVLQDSPAVNIRCRVWLADHPNTPGVATMDISSLTDPSLYQGGMITLLPGSTAEFDARWGYTMTGGAPLWSLIPMHDMADNLGPYKLSDTVQVMMSDTVRLFKPLPDYVFGPRAYRIQFFVR